MDDRMLHEYRRAPDPRFASDLRERLRRQERPAFLPSPRAVRILAAAFAVLVVGVLFAIPSVRVSAQSVLDLFRVRRFAAVELKESRVEMLRGIEKDRGFLVFDQKETILDPGPPLAVVSRDEASSKARFSVSAPGFLPEGLAADSVFVQGEGAMRVSVSESKLRSLLDRLELRDVAVPPGLDGRWIEVRKPPIVIQRFQADWRRAVLIQARSPEVSVPAGWDVERLAEIGLRVLGLDPTEARRMARATDWRTTLLVPVPVDASSFRQVTIHGQQGLLIRTPGERGADGKRGRAGNLLMWTEGDRVFCLKANLNPSNLMQMAESIS